LAIIKNIILQYLSFGFLNEDRKQRTYVGSKAEARILKLLTRSVYNHSERSTVHLLPSMAKKSSYSTGVKSDLI
jgi:hypothetical protein